jgi:hypothetical protein
MLNVMAKQEEPLKLLLEQYHILFRMVKETGVSYTHWPNGA